LLAVTRTTTAATPATSTEIAAKSRSLDQLEASLRRSLAEQPPTQTRAAVDSAPTRTVFVHSGARPQVTGEHEDDHGEDDDAYEHDDDYEGADD
jgi:hypothetical protein